MDDNSKIIPNLSVDCVILGYDHKELKVLIRKDDIGEGGRSRWISKLPGNHVWFDEVAEQTAARTLADQTGVRGIFLKQFKVFSSLDRLTRSEDAFRWITKRGIASSRVVTIGFYAIVRQANMQRQRLSEMAEWKGVQEVGTLIFDHNEILHEALQQLRTDLERTPVIFSLLPKKFTLAQLQDLYQQIKGVPVDKRNFRRLLLTKMPYVVATGDKQQGVPHKPALLYAFDAKRYKKLNQ